MNPFSSLSITSPPPLNFDDPIEIQPPASIADGPLFPDHRYDRSLDGKSPAKAAPFPLQPVPLSELPDVKSATANAPPIDFNSEHARWFSRVGQG